MKKEKYISKCKCGSVKFFVDEAIIYSAVMNTEENILEAHKATESEILKIVCIHCDKRYSAEDFEDIQFV